MAIEQAVVLAAGAGTRLKPITNTRPKSMIKIVGKPLLHYMIENLQKIGVKKAYIIVKYKKEEVINYFEKIRSDLKIKIEFIEQGQNYGTAAAVLEAKNKIDGTFFVVAGDIITTANTLKKLKDEHEGKMSLILKKVENPENYGFAKIKDGYVEKFEEKPLQPLENSYVNCSLYSFEPEILKEIEKIKKSPRGEYEITDLLKTTKAKAIISSDYWMDIGLPWQLFDATKFILENSESRIEGKIENTTVNGKIIVEKGAKIIDSYLEGNIYIGKNTIIGPHSYIKGESSIGEECSIGDSTTIKNSIILDRVNAKHLTYIGDSIIGENCNFGAGTQIANFRFDASPIKAKVNEITIDTKRKKLGAIIGDNVKTGVLSSIMPGKMIGNNCWIGAGVVIKENIEPNTYVELEQKLIYKKIGEIN
ncbi:MAG: sugar phosphate nucleotidyltransferase [Candidatus Micrarchaeota archaeon]|nr:sugar phosphate nucleotidyltransferase [Candidatus Micrarchaeota archaeon]